MGDGKELAIQSTNKFIESFKSSAKKVLAGYLGSPDNVARFYSAMSMCFASNPKLKECSPGSLSTVFMTCAQVGLFPSNWSGECYVIPYNIKGEMTATFQVGYQGLVTLGYRAKTKLIDAHVVYAKDVFSQTLGLNPTLIHEPDFLSGDRGEPVGAYAVAILESDKSIFRFMNKADIWKHRAKSQGKNTASSPWKPENDPQLWMWKKTVLIQLAKLMPKSPIMQQAISAQVESNMLDITPSSADSAVMSEKEIAAFRSDLIDCEGYDDAEIKKARLESIGRDKFGKLTKEEAELIKKQLQQNRDEHAVDCSTTTDDANGEQYDPPTD